MKKHLLICTAILIYFFTNLSFAEKTYSSVENMVSEQRVIRVLLDEAPGFGNQAATINLMNRVWQMGFHGIYEFIYPNESDEDVQKVISLFNLPIKDPKNLPAVFSYEDKQHHKITFMSARAYINQLINHKIYPVALGMSGAHDLSLNEDCYYIPACKEIAKNNADFTNTSIFVELQPWILAPQMDTIYLRHVEAGESVTPPGKYLVYPVANFQDAKNYIADDADGKIFANNHPGLKPLIEGIESRNFNFLPVYGFTFQEKYSRPYDDGSSEENLSDVNMFIHNITQVLTGARYAQLHGSSEFKKPLIIAVFYDYTEEIKQLNTFIQTNQLKYEDKLNAEIMSNTLLTLGFKTPNIFLTASLTDTDVSRKIQSLQPGQILLLSMGALPKNVFDGIYSHVAPNVWPQIREGEGSLSMLLLKGKPHFRCRTDYYYEDDENNGRWEPGFDLIADVSFKNQMKNFYGKNGFCAENNWSVNPNLYKILGELIIASKSSNSLFAQYFSALQEDASKPEYDRIHRAFEEALKVANQSTRTIH
jgi:hypothetical protein